MRAIFPVYLRGDAGLLSCELAVAFLLSVFVQFIEPWRRRSAILTWDITLHHCSLIVTFIKTVV